MGCAWGTFPSLAELSRRKDHAGVCVPPWRPDLRPEMADPRGAWPAFARALRDLFRTSRGAAHRGLKPEPVGR